VEEGGRWWRRGSKLRYLKICDVLCLMLMLSKFLLLVVCSEVYSPITRNVVELSIKGHK